MAFAVIAVIPSVTDDSDAADITYISGTINSAQEYKQPVVINGNTTIAAGGGITIEENGSLTINSGVTITITTDDTVTAKITVNSGDFTNNGTIILNDTKGIIALGGDGKLTNNGTISVSNGQLTINSAMTNNGVISIASNAKIQLAEGLTNKSGATTTINGTIIGSGTITNSGTLTINATLSATDTAPTVALADGASVTVTGITFGAAAQTFTISGTNTVKAVLTLKGTTAEDKITGLTVTQSSKTTSGVVAEYLDIAGNISATLKTSTALDTISLSGSYTDSKTNSSTFTITGTVYLASTVNVDTITGAVDISGKLYATKEISALASSGSAVHYDNSASSTQYTVIYTTLATAISDGATLITLDGTAKVTADLTIPENVNVTGSAMTIASGATVTNNGNLSSVTKVTVEGVLISGSTVNAVSDVVITNDDLTSYTYCNISYALTNAASGDTISISKDSTGVTATSNLTIPEGVTLDNNGMKLDIGTYTLTINGTLKIDDVDNITISKGKVVLNGLVQASTNDIATYFGIAGGYYITSEGYFLAPVEDAVAVITSTTDKTVTVIGSENSTYTYGNLTVASTEESGAVTLKVTAPATFGTVTLDGAIFNVAAKVTATVSDGTNSVALKDIATITVTEDDGLTVAGTDATSTGTVTVAGSVSTGALDVVTLVVNGTLTVPTSGELTADKLYVLGTLDVANKATVDAIFIGYSDDGVTAATVSGNGSITMNTGAYAVVSAGSTVSEGFTAAVQNYKTVTYNKDGSAYATLYGDADNTTGVSISSVKPFNTTGSFKGWVNSSNVDVSDYAFGSETEATKITDDMTVSASIEEKAYLVIVQTVTGVSNVYLDGAIMSYGSINDGTGYYYAYYAYVSAGNHTVTYSVSNGYEMGSTTSYSVTATGAVEYGDDAPEYEIYNVSITGVTEKTSSDSGSSTGLTDYLLIILVVLIAVMAVVIAARLLRS